MTTPPDAGQALPPPASMTLPEALRQVARAARDLREHGVVEVGPALAAYRTLQPVAHGGSLARAPDLAFLAATSAFGPPLLDAEMLTVAGAVPRAPPFVTSGAAEGTRAHVAPGVEATADALTLALGLALEAAKLQVLLDDADGDDDLLALTARAHDSTKAAVAASLDRSEAEATEMLEAILHGGVARRVYALPEARAPIPLDEVLLDVANDDDAPLFVLAGATERLQDLLSPFVRRLESPLAHLAGSTSADELYAALPLLLAEEPRCEEERLAVESREGFTPCGGALVVRFDRVDASRADERARPQLRALKQSRARAVLCARFPTTLAEVLARTGRRTRAVIVLAEALGGQSPYPDVVIDAESGHPLDFDNALADGDDGRETACTYISPPSLGLSPRAHLEHGVGCAPLLAPLLLEAAHARAAGTLARRARLAAGTFAPGDSEGASAVALRVLSRMSGVTPLARRQTRRP